MVIQEAIELFKEHPKSTVKKSTLKSYGKFLDQFRDRFSIKTDLTVDPLLATDFLFGLAITSWALYNLRMIQLELKASYSKRHHDKELWIDTDTRDQA